MSRSRFDPLERLPQFGEYYRGALRRQNRNLLLQQQQQNQQPEFPSDSDISGDHYDVTFDQQQHQQRHQHHIPTQQQMQQQIQPQLPSQIQSQQQQQQHLQQLQPQQQFHAPKYSSRRVENIHRPIGPLSFDNLGTDAYDSFGEEVVAGGDDDGCSSSGSLQEDRRRGRSIRWRQTEQRVEKIFSSPQVEVLLQVNTYECSRCGRRCSRVSMPPPQSQTQQPRQPQHPTRPLMSSLSPLAPVPPPLPSRRYRQQGLTSVAPNVSDASSGRHWKGTGGDRRARHRARRY